MLKPPIFGELIHKVSIARFSHTLGSLTSPVCRSCSRWTSCRDGRQPDRR